MHVLLFVIYFTLFSLAFIRIPFILNSGIKPIYLFALFFIHVFMGCLHNWIAYQYYPNHGDIWFFFEDSLIMKQEFIKHPLHFVSRIFTNESYLNLTGSNDVRFQIQYEFMKYINLAFNFISFDNFYINTLIFSLFTFFGNIALFRFLKSFYFNNVLSAFMSIIFPSTLFFTSCIHKDGLLYMSMGFVCFYFYRLLKNRTLRNILCCLVFVLISFVARPNIYIAFLPAAFFWLLSNQSSYFRPHILYLATLTVIVSLLFADNYFNWGIIQTISNRQAEFRSLTGNSKIYLPALAPTFESIVSVFPLALLNGFFQPLPGSGGQIIYTLFSIELMVCWLLVGYSVYVVFRNKYFRFEKFDHACILFCLSGMIMIGYIVPFAGAIVRYRCIYLPFLMVTFINLLVKSNQYPARIANSWLLKNMMVSTNYDSSTTAV